MELLEEALEEEDVVLLNEEVVVVTLTELTTLKFQLKMSSPTCPT